MEGEIKDILRLALNNILEKPFKSFKRKLSEYEHPEYNKIGRSDLENKDREEVVDLIISHYTVHVGSEIVTRILQDINECQVSAELLERLAAVLKSNKKRKSGNTDLAAVVNFKKRKSTDPAADLAAHRDEGGAWMEQCAGTPHIDFVERPPIFNSASSPPTPAHRVYPFVSHMYPAQQVSNNQPLMQGPDNRSQNQRRPVDEHRESMISDNDPFDLLNDLKPKLYREMSKIIYRR